MLKLNLDIFLFWTNDKRIIEGFGISYLLAFLLTLAPVLLGNKCQFLLQRPRRHNLPHPHRRHHHRPLLLHSPAHLTLGRGYRGLLHILQNITIKINILGFKREKTMQKVFQLIRFKLTHRLCPFHYWSLFRDLKDVFCTIRWINYYTT